MISVTAVGSGGKGQCLSLTKVSGGAKGDLGKHIILVQLDHTSVKCCRGQASFLSTVNPISNHC